MEDKSSVNTIHMISLNGKIYIDIDSLKRWNDHMLKGTIEMSDEEKKKNQFSEDFIEGAATSFNLVKDYIENAAQNFAVDSELDALGLGQGNTKILKIDEK